jgi:hypothetical protein
MFGYTGRRRRDGRRTWGDRREGRVGDIDRHRGLSRVDPIRGMVDLAGRAPARDRNPVGQAATPGLSLEDLTRGSVPRRVDPEGTRDRNLAGRAATPGLNRVARAEAAPIGRRLRQGRRDPLHNGRVVAMRRRQVLTSATNARLSDTMTGRG